MKYNVKSKSTDREYEVIMRETPHRQIVLTVSHVSRETFSITRMVELSTVCAGYGEAHDIASHTIADLNAIHTVSS